MAFIFEGVRPRIARQMSAGNNETRKWLAFATFAKTANGYWLAWQGGSTDKIAVLPPDHPTGAPCRWLESWDNDPIEAAIAYVESGQFEEDGEQVLNLFIQNPKTGKFE